MSFYISDELKDRVSEEGLTGLYHEEKEIDVIATFFIDDGTHFKCPLLSLEKDTKKKKLDVKIDIGLDENLMNNLLSDIEIKRISFTVLQSEYKILEIEEPHLELVKIKKINERISYFARIIIV